LHCKKAGIFFVISIKHKLIMMHVPCNRQVNNAGIVLKGSIETTSLEDFDKVMRINMR